jgi:steroid delta-isomerase-like uncharacterized protein
MKKNFLKFVILSLIFLIVQGCDQNKKIDLMKIVDNYRQTFNSHDAAAMAQLYTEDAVYVAIGQQKPLHGRTALQESYANVIRAYPDAETVFNLIMVSEDHFMAEGVIQGTNTGPMSTPEGDIPPTGQKFEMKIAFIAKVTPDGLIAEDRTYGM